MSDRILDTASILTSAEIASGTYGLIEDGLRARLDALLASFRSNTDITTDQQIATRRQLVRLMARRLGIARDVANHPEILNEEIVDPIFVIGFGRTGTSIQQALLGADPANRTVAAWQVHEPSPPPGQMPVAPGRRAAAAGVVQHYCDRCPGILSLHPYWDELADTLIEDEEILLLDLHDIYPVALCDAPAISVRVGSDDFEDAYRFLKLFMQHQQWKLPKKRWIMKGIEHQRHLSTLFRIFPDARCLFPHREPATFLPSNLAIAAVVYDGITDGAMDRRSMAAGYLADFKRRIDAVIAEPGMDDPRVRHVNFNAFIRDPIASLRGCYEAWGFGWTAEAEEAMRAWLANPANNGDRYGRHRYTFEPFGIDWAQHSGDYDEYRSRYLGDTYE